MKKFFRSMEERFVFPIGRRTWQILALIGLLGLAAFIIWFLINLTPTGRDEVKINRNEVVYEQPTVVSTRSEEPLPPPPACNPEDYQAQVSLLKQDLPNAEWNNLGDSSDPYTIYLTDEYGNYQFDEYGNYVTGYKRDFRRNPKAIPNILESLFEERGLDTNQICERTNLLKCLHLLSSQTSGDYLEKEAFMRYADLLANARNINEGLLNMSFSLKSQIDGQAVIIKNRPDLNSLFKYLQYFTSNNISDAQIEISISLIDAHRKLSPSFYDKSEYFEIAEIIFENNLPIDELKTAMNAFREDLSYYDKHELDRSLKRFLNIYEDKLSRAESEQMIKQRAKEGQRIFALIAIGICFASIISIATILLLYSIQQLLKDHVLKNKS